MVYITSDNTFDGQHIITLTSIAKSVNKEVMLIIYSKDNNNLSDIQ